MVFFRFLLVGCIVLLASCSFLNGEGNRLSYVFIQKGDYLFLSDDEEIIYYQFNKPDKTLKLSKKLKEISGLTYNSNAQTLLTINDEQGLIFEIDPDKGKILNETRFGLDGDYEGIAREGKYIYVTESNGDIHRFNTLTNKSETILTPLSSVNNVEGLYYDSGKHRLLIACKGKVLEGGASRGQRAVYKFNLKKSKFSESPFILLRREKILDYLDERGGDLKKESLKEYKQRVRYFSPSGIAIHPLNGDIYLLSARGNMLLILNKNKQISQLVFFDKSIVPQPEGICFDQEGNLFIGSEGKSKAGKLFVFKIS
ncbi:hypothetical protein E9993_04310 [Labilibacter sediminis]|nr:hypothetical protein E9993_04310 [Labilibacter sediminis]